MARSAKRTTSAHAGRPGRNARPDAVGKADRFVAARAASSALNGGIVAFDEPEDRLVQQSLHVGIEAEGDHLPRALFEQRVEGPCCSIARGRPSAKLHRLVRVRVR